MLDRDGARLRVEEARLALSSAARRRSSLVIVLFKDLPARAIRTSRRRGSGSLALANRDCTGTSAISGSLGGHARGVAPPDRPAATAVGGALGRRARARVDDDVGDHDDRRRRPLRQQIPRPPAKAPHLGRPRHERQAGHLPRAGDQRPERAVADRVLEPLDQARRQPRRLGARARARPGRRSSIAHRGRCPGTPTAVRPRRQRRRAPGPHRPEPEPGHAQALPQAGRPALAAARRLAAGLLRRLVPRMVLLHLLQAEPARHARHPPRTDGVRQRDRPAGPRADLGRHRQDLRRRRRRCSSTSTGARRRSSRTGASRRSAVRVARTPVRVELNIKGDLPRLDLDPRNLGAQVGFTFVPAKQPQH